MILILTFLPLIDLIQNDFAVLKEKYKWVLILFIFYQAKIKFIQHTYKNMLDDNSYRNEDIYASIKRAFKTKK